MSAINKDVLSRCLIESTLKEIREIESNDYSFIKANEEFKKRILNASKNKNEKGKCYPKKIALIIVATLAICFFIMFAVSAQIRTTVIDFFIEVYEDFTAFCIKKDNDTSSFKAIETIYEPAYFHNNSYERITQNNDELSVFSIWQNNNFTINFSQYTLKDNDITLDSKNTSYQTLMLGEQKVYYTFKNDVYFVKWLAYGYSFCLNCKEGLGWEEIEKIVLSLEPISE